MHANLAQTVYWSVVYDRVLDAAKALDPHAPIERFDLSREWKLGEVDAAGRLLGVMHALWQQMSTAQLSQVPR